MTQRTTPPRLETKPTLEVWFSYMKDVKSNYKHMEFNLIQLEFGNAFNGRPSSSSKKRSISIYWQNIWTVRSAFDKTECLF